MGKPSHIIHVGILRGDLHLDQASYVSVATLQMAKGSWRYNTTPYHRI